MTDIQRMRAERIENLFSAVPNDKDKPWADELVAADDVPGGYYFPDVDYTDKSRSVWKPAAHCGRLSREIALGGEERLRTDAEWRNKMLGAYNYWLIKDFLSDNWWYNQIASPQSVLSIAIMLDEYLTPEMRELVEQRALRGSFKAHLMLGMENYTEMPRHNGMPDNWRAANLMWAATTTVTHALWTLDEELLRLASARVAKEICYSYTGIQEDGAFVQHGRRWYSGGYGAVFVTETAPIISMLGGTEFAIPKEKMDILLTHVLDGQRYMQRNGRFDIGAIGRDYSRKSGYAPGSLARAVKTLSETPGIQRADELRDFYTALMREGDFFEGTKYYPSITQLCHKKNGIYIGVRGRGEGVLGAEHCNEEGILSYNMSYGTVTCVLEHGFEYMNVSPIWDYSKIPGTTARDEGDEELLSKVGWSETVETDCRANGYTDGSFGLLTERAVHDGISLSATYFTFGGAMVALGADIFDERGEALHTTVEQCIPGEVKIEKNLVQNGKVFYKNLDATTEFISSCETKSGRWYRNNHAGSQDEVSGELLTITIPVSSGDTYAYMVYTADEPTITLLSNTADCQAILADGKLMAAFHTDTEITVGDKKISGKCGELVIRDI